MARVTKKRNWAFVVYPESAPEDWRDIIQQTGLIGAISPLHDKDVDKDHTGEDAVKKPHYHVIVSYAGPTSFNVVKALTDQLHAPMPIPLERIRGYYRYFIHKDNPEKYQYDEKEIVPINGFNILDYVELTKAEVDEIKKEIVQLIRIKKFSEYSQLVDYLIDGDTQNYFSVVASNTMFFNKYITSLRHRQKDSQDMMKKKIEEEVAKQLKAQAKEGKL